MFKPIRSCRPALLLLLLLTYPTWLPAATLTLTVSPGTAVLGNPVTLTATMAPPASTGKVTFYDGTTVLGTSTISAGTASLSTTMLPAGARSLRAYYVTDGATSNVIPYSVTANPSAGTIRDAATSGAKPCGLAWAMSPSVASLPLASVPTDHTPVPQS